MIARSASDMILATHRDVAQSGSALGWGPSGRRFESGRPDFLRARDRLRERRTHERPEGFGDCLPIAGHRRVYGHYRRLLLWRVRGPRLPVQPLRGRQVAREEIGYAHHATQRPFERSIIPAPNDLHVVELSCLIFHKAYDPARPARIREKIAADAVQRNPVIIAPYGDRYLLLDGAHRARALGELGCRFALAQPIELSEGARSCTYLLEELGMEEAFYSIEEVEVSETEP